MKKRRTKKAPPPYLRLVTGGKLSPAKKAWVTRKAEKLAKDKDVTVLAIDRPLIAIVSPAELDPAKGLSAKTYLDAASERDAKFDGRSRIYPEINVLNSAKAWHRGMIRLARSEGYTDMKKFFKESEIVNAHDKALFFMTQSLVEWENKEARRGS